MNDVGKARHTGKAQLSAMFLRFFGVVVFLSFLAFLDFAVKHGTIFDSYAWTCQSLYVKAHNKKWWREKFAKIK